MMSLKSAVATSLSLLFGLQSLVFVLVAVITTHWIKDIDGESGLWYKCLKDGGDCKNIYIGTSKQYKHYEMVRGFSVLACVMGVVGVLLCILGFIKKMKIQPNVIATAFIVQAFFVLVAFALFTSIQSSYAKEISQVYNWGYSFKLGWTAFPCSVVAATIMMVFDFIKK